MRRTNLKKSRQVKPKPRQHAKQRHTCFEHRHRRLHENDLYRISLFIAQTIILNQISRTHVITGLVPKSYNFKAFIMEQLPFDEIPQEVVNIMILCGLSDVVPDPNPNGVASPAERIAEETFQDSFEHCIEMSYERLVKDVRAYSRLPVDPIHVSPGVRNKLHAFIEWAKHCYRCGFDPQTTVFPVDNLREFIIIGKSHAKFVANSDKMLTSAKPNVFKATDSWPMWSPLVVNFLRQIAGVDGAPLSYIVIKWSPSTTQQSPTFRTFTKRLHHLSVLPSTRTPKWCIRSS